MENSEIKLLKVEELKERIGIERENLQRLKFAHTISPIENPMKIREAKRLVARLITELRAKELTK